MEGSQVSTAPGLGEGVSSEPGLSTSAIDAHARSLGFSLFGVTTAEPTDHMPFYRAWLDRSFHGEMAYLARPDAQDRRAALEATMESVRSVIVVGDMYGRPGPSDADDPSVGVIARYARGRDYHRVVKRKLLALHRWLDGEMPGGVRGRAYVDTGPILERDLARRAGLGWYGRNTMLINPSRGSYFFVGLLLVDVALTPTTPFDADRCGTCHACLDACPTGALLGRDEDGAPIIDARRCISYLTIELRGSIPVELRPAIGNRIYGCDICQEVCPWNERFAAEATEPGYAARGPGERPIGVETVRGEAVGLDRPPHPGTEAPSLVELMRMNRDDWEAFSRGSAIRRVGHAGFRRNVAVAIGNWLSELDEAPEGAATVLTEALEDDSDLVREHALWALGRPGRERR